MQNEAGHSEYTYEIVVYLAPISKNTTEFIDAIAGTSVRVDCDIDGLPMPNVRTERNTRRVHSMHCILIPIWFDPSLQFCLNSILIESFYIEFFTDKLDPQRQSHIRRSDIDDRKYLDHKSRRLFMHSEE